VHWNSVDLLWLTLFLVGTLSMPIVLGVISAFSEKE
jgi:hypothetical protein